MVEAGGTFIRGLDCWIVGWIVLFIFWNKNSALKFCSGAHWMKLGIRWVGGWTGSWEDVRIGTAQIVELCAREYRSGCEAGF